MHTQTSALPLLLTGTIDPTVFSPDLTKISTADRLMQYQKAIRFYITQSPFNRIVFIENSGYDFVWQQFAELAKAHSKRFEFLRGSFCREECNAYGIGYGDALLIHEALEQSELLRDVEYFYKITGRLICKNLNKVLKTRDKYRNEFIIYQFKGWCMTWFFKVNRQDYMQFFDDVYQECNERTLHDMEICFYERIRDRHIPVGSFETYPYMEGLVGSHLTPYSGRLPKRIIQNIMARCHCFTYNAKTSILFSKLLNRMGVKRFTE